MTEFPSVLLIESIMTMEILLSNPRGFCAGVDRAIEIVDRAIEVFGAPIYVRHEVVHNRYVVEGLRERGAVFVEELSEVPENSTVIFSAHGVSKAIQEEAKLRGLQVFDATCPLVTKVHIEVHHHANQGREIESLCRASSGRSPFFCIDEFRPDELTRFFLS